MEQSKEVNRTAEDILNLKRLNISISGKESKTDK
jgi:hypothetical protein